MRILPGFLVLSFARGDGATVPALQPGDLVEVVNEHIGVLANRVARAT